MNKNRILTTVLVIIAILFSLLCLGAERKPRPTPPFMRQKLVYSQGILEGLALEKYDVVITNATLLRNMNLTNIFTKTADPYYAKSINDFQAKVDVVIRGAQNKQLDGTTEAYTKVVESCVACHRECRFDQFQGKQSSTR